MARTRLREAEADGRRLRPRAVPCCPRSGAWLGGLPRSAEQRERAARQLLSGIHVSASIGNVSLAATHAIADFGIEEGIRLVRVRIVDELQLGVRIEADRDVAFAEPPRLCLVGPFWAPDDAGLSDRCWGEPDLGRLLAAQLATDAAGHPSLEAHRPISITTMLRRGEVRCDYPAGAWQLEVSADPLVDGSPVGDSDLPRISLDVPFDPVAVLPLLRVDETRYCGLASVVYREQGEPPVLPPCEVAARREARTDRRA